MKTIKNINHWISELRALAIKAKVYNEERFREQFNNGLTPDEAFQEEMELWADDL